MQPQDPEQSCVQMKLVDVSENQEDSTRTTTEFLRDDSPAVPKTSSESDTLPQGFSDTAEMKRRRMQVEREALKAMCGQPQRQERFTSPSSPSSHRSRKARAVVGAQRRVQPPQHMTALERGIQRLGAKFVRRSVQQHAHVRHQAATLPQRMCLSVMVC